MKRTFFHIMFAGICVFLLFSCRKESSVIPRDKMSEIYAEMFVADQWISSHYKARKTADTSWVYEPIFEKYGYTADDYRASVEYYLQDPDRYARILRQTTVIIEGHIRDLKRQKELLESISRMRSGRDRYAPDRIYYLTGVSNPGKAVADSVTYCVDSAGGRYDFDPSSWADTVFAGPVMFVHADSLLMASDSTLAVPQNHDADDSDAVRPVIQTRDERGTSPVMREPAVESVRASGTHEKMEVAAVRKK